MLLWVVGVVLACGDARDQDAAWSRVGPLEDLEPPEAQLPAGPPPRGGRSRQPSPRCWRGGGRRPAGSWRGTGPTCWRWACSWSGPSSPSGCGPTSPGRWAAGWPTVPAPSSAGPGWRSRWRASPSAWCCSGRGGRRPPIPTPRPSTVEAGPAERPTVRIAIGALLLFVADVGILHLAVRPPVAERALDDLRDAGGALGAMIADPLIAATGVVGASRHPRRRRAGRAAARARHLDRR